MCQFQELLLGYPYDVNELPIATKAAMSVKISPSTSDGFEIFPQCLVWDRNKIFVQV